MAKLNKRCPAHPGRLVREYTGDTLTITTLAAHLGITRTNLSRLINGHGGVSADLSLRLSETFHTTPEL
jgi:antitoxin HigA-1